MGHLLTHDLRAAHHLSEYGLADDRPELRSVRRGQDLLPMRSYSRKPLDIGLSHRDTRGDDLSGMAIHLKQAWNEVQR